MNIIHRMPGLKMFFWTFLIAGLPGTVKMNSTEVMLMDNTIYQYSDVNGNSYYFYISPAGNCIMEYDPVKEIESSSGEYTGGTMFITVIAVADYNYLIQLLKLAISNKISSENAGPKGNVAITIKTSKEKIYQVEYNSDVVRTIQSLITLYKKKYIVTTGKADAGLDTLLISGRIREQFYESKKGIVTDVKEYYFIPGEKEQVAYKLEKEYFIKLWEGRILKNELVKYLGEDVTIRTIFKKGLWDATDEQHASRFGDYVTIFEIIKNK
ncbi:MAG: hypothetical protein HOP10_01450 [Chitinophagaceae bacterium]|nr:hypothetical protein [Chitinophagaceae bacterium]